MFQTNSRATIAALLLSASLLVTASLLGCSDSPRAPERKAGATPIDPATVASIRVGVGYTGVVPAPQPINMSGTPACAAAHPEPVFDRAIAVEGGRLENAVVYIKAGLGDRGFPTPSDPAVVDQKGCLYDPRVAAAMVGQPVKFVNSDPEPHNVRGRPQNVKAWNFMIPVQNASRTVEFDKPEVGIRVGCDIHPWMVAYLSIFDHPYFGVSKSDGPVVLEDLPPGDYVVAAWHEKLGTLEKSVSVPARGSLDLDLTYGDGSGAP